MSELSASALGMHAGIAFLGVRLGLVCTCICSYRLMANISGLDKLLSWYVCIHTFHGIRCSRGRGCSHTWGMLGHGDIVVGGISDGLVLTG